MLIGIAPARPPERNLTLKGSIMKLHLGAHVFALATFVAVPVFGHDALSLVVQQQYKLKDGTTLYVFKDGKMAKEDRYGRATSLKKGEVLKLADGRKITAVGNEVARLDRLLNDGHRN